MAVDADRADTVDAIRVRVRRQKKLILREILKKLVGPHRALFEPPQPRNR